MDRVQPKRKLLDIYTDFKKRKKNTNFFLGRYRKVFNQQ